MTDTPFDFEAPNSDLAYFRRSLTSCKPVSLLNQTLFLAGSDTYPGIFDAEGNERKVIQLDANDWKVLDDALKNSAAVKQIVVNGLQLNPKYAHHMANQPATSQASIGMETPVNQGQKRLR